MRAWTLKIGRRHGEQGDPATGVDSRPSWLVSGLEAPAPPHETSPPVPFHDPGLTLNYSRQQELDVLSGAPATSPALDSDEAEWAAAGRPEPAVMNKLDWLCVLLVRRIQVEEAPPRAGARSHKKPDVSIGNHVARHVFTPESAAAVRRCIYGKARLYDLERTLWVRVRAEFETVPEPEPIVVDLMPKKRGRQRIITDERITEVRRRLEAGENLQQICKQHYREWGYGSLDSMRLGLRKVLANLPEEAAA